MLGLFLLEHMETKITTQFLTCLTLTVRPHQFSRSISWTNGANKESDKSGASGEDEKEAPKSDNVDVMEEDDDEIELPPIEFDPEVQAKLVRWSPEFAECSITLYLPMPTYMTQGAMMDAAKAALNREKQLLDMRVSAGSRVVIKVRQAELKSWIGERNWFVLEHER